MRIKKVLENTRLTPEMAARCHSEAKSAEESAVAGSTWTSAEGQTLAQLLKRPEVTIEQLAPALTKLAPAFFTRNSSVTSVLPVVKSINHRGHRGSQGQATFST